jgi:hypothetical protein
MSQSSQVASLVPQAKITGVQKALLATFNVNDVEDILLRLCTGSQLTTTLICYAS